MWQCLNPKKWPSISLITSHQLHSKRRQPSLDADTLVPCTPWWFHLFTDDYLFSLFTDQNRRREAWSGSKPERSLTDFVATIILQEFILIMKWQKKDGKGVWWNINEYRFQNSEDSVFFNSSGSRNSARPEMIFLLFSC